MLPRPGQSVRAACTKLMSKKLGGDASKLAIKDLVALLVWRGKKPASTKKEDKEAIVSQWRALNVPGAELAAQARVGSPDGEAEEDDAEEVDADVRRRRRWRRLGQW